MTPGAATQPPSGRPRTAEEVVEQYRAAMARGAATVRAQTGADDADGRVAEEDVRLSAEGEAGGGGMEDAARPGAGEQGRIDGAASEQPVGQVERGGPVLEPVEARNGGTVVAVAETALAEEAPERRCWTGSRAPM